MELIFLYLKLVAGSVIGMIVQLMAKNKSQNETAQKANLQYSFSYFISNDKASIIWTFLGVSTLFLLTNSMIKNMLLYTPNVVKPYIWGFIYLSVKDIAEAIVISLYLTAGYMGQDFILRYLGRTSKELKAGIDYKTTQADTANGTLDNPTPVK